MNKNSESFRLIKRLQDTIKDYLDEESNYEEFLERVSYIVDELEMTPE